MECVKYLIRWVMALGKLVSSGKTVCINGTTFAINKRIREEPWDFRKETILCTRGIRGKQHSKSRPYRLDG